MTWTTIYACSCRPLSLHPLTRARRKYPIREVLNVLRWIAHTGAQWAYLPQDFPPAATVRQQAQRWFEAGCFENAAHDLRVLARVEKARRGEPTAIIDGRTLQSTPQSAHRAGYDGAKKCERTKAHLAVEVLGHLLAVLTTPASVQDRAQVNALCLEIQEATGVSIEWPMPIKGLPERKTPHRQAWD